MMGYALRPKKEIYDEDEYRLHQDNFKLRCLVPAFLAKWAYCVVVRWAIARPLHPPAYIIVYWLLRGR